MNHLAHCFLSFGDDELLLGNFIGDFVKGHAWQQYAPGIQQGILLHRGIDSFTDQHLMTRRSVDRIRPFARRYSGPVTDVLYDHLLFVNWSLYSETPFDDFAAATYAGLERQAVLMPAILQERFPRMLAANFLHGYTTRESMSYVLDRFSRRLPPELDMAGLTAFFFDQLDRFSEDFNAFFPELIAFARKQIVAGG